MLAAGAQWYPDGKRILLAAAERQRGTRLYELAIKPDGIASPPRPISPEGVTRSWHAISPDGRLVLASHIDGNNRIYNTSDGSSFPAPGMAKGELPVRWCEDPRFVYIRSGTTYPVRIYKVELASGRRQLWKEIAAPDATGIRSITPFRMTPDGKWYAYSVETILDDLYLIDGLA